MPGFNIGGGSTGSQPSNQEEVNRNHRWRIITLGENLISRDRLVFAKTLQLPSFSIEEESVMGAHIKYKFAKCVNWEDVVVTFYDTDDLLDLLIEWQNKVFDNQAGIKLANDYKRRSAFALTDGDGTESDIKYQLINSWPKSISHSQLSYEDSEIKLINLTLSYDFAVVAAGEVT